MKDALKRFVRREKDKTAAALADDVQRGEAIAAAFERAILQATAEEQKNTPAEEAEVKYSTSISDYEKPIIETDIEALRRAIPNRKSVNSFSEEDIVATAKWAHKYDQQIGIKSPFFRAGIGEWRSHDQTSVNVSEIPTISSNDIENYLKSRRSISGIENLDTKTNGDSHGWLIRSSSEGERNTNAHSGDAGLSYKALTGINSLIQNAILLDSETHEEYHILPDGKIKKAKSTKNDTVAFNHRFYALGKTEDGSINLYRITVEDAFQDKKHQQSFAFHNLKHIEKVANIDNGRTGDQSRSHGTIYDDSATKFTVADLYGFVKKYDSEFHAGREINPLLLNNDGTPKVFYHGSPADFHAFDKRKSKYSNLYGRGFYFTDSESHGKTYGKLYSVYLNLVHPITPGGDKVSRAQVRAFLEAIASDKYEDYDLDNYGQGKTIDDVLDLVYNKDAFAVIQDINAAAIGDFVEAVKIFNDVNGTDFDGIVTKTETVAFEPEQIKSATDNIGEWFHDRLLRC